MSKKGDGIKLANHSDLQALQQLPSQVARSSSYFMHLLQFDFTERWDVHLQGGVQNVGHRPGVAGKAKHPYLIIQS